MAPKQTNNQITKDMKTAEQLNEERKYQKPKEELNHIWNIEYILKCLFKMNEGDQWPYFEAYGREFIQNFVDQQVTASTAELHARIAELEKQVPKWISVDERLPEDGSNVMIMHERYGVMYGYFSETWHSGAFDELSAVTHWMPLPQPLK